MGEDVSISLIVPAYTEEVSLRRNIGRALQDNDDSIKEVIIIVSAYADKGTIEACRQLSRENAKVFWHLQRNNPGLGRALRQGFDLAGGTHIQILYADSESDPGEVKNFIRRVREDDADMVVGSRWIKPENVKNYPPLRYVFNRAYQICARLLFRSRLHDFTFGFNLMRTDMVKRIKYTGTRHEIATEMLLKPLRLGYRIVEIPVPWIRRSEGQSKLKITRYLLYPVMALKIALTPAGRIRRR